MSLHQSRDWLWFTRINNLRIHFKRLNKRCQVKSSLCEVILLQITIEMTSLTSKGEFSSTNKYVRCTILYLVMLMYYQGMIRVICPWYYPFTILGNFMLEKSIIWPNHSNWHLGSQSSRMDPLPPGIKIKIIPCTWVYGAKRYNQKIV